LQDAADELASAVEEAKQMKVEPPDEYKSTLAIIMAIAQKRQGVKARVEEFGLKAEAVLQNPAFASHSAIEVIIAALHANLDGAQDAHVPTPILDRAAHSCKELERLFEKRQGAFARMMTARERLDRCKDPAAKLRVGPEFEQTIHKAEHVELDVETTAIARAHLERVTALANLTVETNNSRHAIKWFSRSQTSIGLQNAISALDIAVERVDGFSSDLDGQEASALADAKDVLVESQVLNSSHSVATVRMQDASKAVQTAIADPNVQQDVLKAMVNELTSAIEEAKVSHVPKALVKQAMHVLTPARAAARFG